jgi:hypothetical protein
MVVDEKFDNHVVDEWKFIIILYWNEVCKLKKEEGKVMHHEKWGEGQSKALKTLNKILCSPFLKPTKTMLSWEQRIYLVGKIPYFYYKLYYLANNICIFSFFKLYLCL